MFLVYLRPDPNVLCSRRNKDGSEKTRIMANAEVGIYDYYMIKIREYLRPDDEVFIRRVPVLTDHESFKSVALEIAKEIGLKKVNCYAH
jgi:hypothetical protein